MLVEKSAKIGGGNAVEIGGGWWKIDLRITEAGERWWKSVEAGGG